MNFFEVIKICFTKKYFDFKGRASRSEFWLYVLFYYSFTAILYIIGFKFNSDFIIGLGLLFYFIIGLIPFISVTTRRLHDINKTGFAQFIVLIPFLGILILIIWCVTEGEKKKNFYGPPIKFKK